MTKIERDRRHSELCPRFQVSIEALGSAGQTQRRLRVTLLGPLAYVNAWVALVTPPALAMRVRDDQP